MDARSRARNGQLNGEMTPRAPDLVASAAGQVPEMSPTSKEFKESFASRRTSSQQLSPLKMKQTPRGVDTIDGPASRREVEEEGVVLFNEFLEKRLAETGIQETVVIERAVTSATVQSQREAKLVNMSSFHFDRQEAVTTSTSTGSNGSMTPSLTKYDNPKWAKNGRDLRKLADDFAKSRERQGVRAKAEETVGDEEINATMFWDLLSELFYQGRVTRERIVVLFFFCTDVAIFALQRNSVEYFHRFMVWALHYIRRNVCSWVADNGGWDVVLYASGNTLLMIAKTMVVAVAVYYSYKMAKSVYKSIMR